MIKRERAMAYAYSNQVHTLLFSCFSVLYSKNCGNGRQKHAFHIFCKKIAQAPHVIGTRPEMVYHKVGSK